MQKLTLAAAWIQWSLEGRRRCRGRGGNDGAARVSPLLSSSRGVWRAAAMEKGLGLGWIEASSRGGRGQLTWLGVEGEEEPLCLLGVEGEDSGGRRRKGGWRRPSVVAGRCSSPLVAAAAGEEPLPAEWRGSSRGRG